MLPPHPPSKQRKRPHCAHVCACKCAFVEYQSYKLVYRRYASLFFIVGVDEHEVRWPPPLYQRAWPDLGLREQRREKRDDCCCCYEHRVAKSFVVLSGLLVFTSYMCCLMQNELGIYEFIHNLVETFDRYFEHVVSSIESRTNTDAHTMT